MYFEQPSFIEIVNSILSVVGTLVEMDFLKGAYTLEVKVSPQNPLRLYSSPRPKFMWQVAIF